MLPELSPFLKPFYIGAIKVDPPIILAPMSQVTTYDYRSIVKEMGGCGLVYTELLSSTAIQYGNARTDKMMNWGDNERPLAVQLFGADPVIMAEGAKAVAGLGADIVDINMGCWVPKVAKKGAGAALMKTPGLAADIVGAVVKAVDIPVTVKIRAGWYEGQVTAIDFAKAAAERGAKLIAVHGRYARQGFTGNADWTVIRRVKETVNVPVIGNGDIFSPLDARRMFEETGCDGIMIGRAAIGNPWIFPRTFHYLKSGKMLPEPSFEERVKMALHHAQQAVKTSRFDERQVCMQLRTQLPPYLMGIPGKRSFNRALIKCDTLKEIETLFQSMLEYGWSDDGLDRLEESEKEPVSSRWPECTL